MLVTQKKQIKEHLQEARDHRMIISRQDNKGETFLALNYNE